MKKIFATVLALVMVFAMSTTAFAADVTLTDEETSTTFDVNAKYETDASKFAVISVDVEYGAMQFTYVTTGSSTGVWDPATHTYGSVDTATAEWRVDNESNKIVVTNHSNRDVNVTAAATTSANTVRWGDTTVSVDNTEAVKLNAGVENAYDDASNTTFTVNVSGDPGAGTGSVDYEVIGSITVTIAPLDTVTTA